MTERDAIRRLAARVAEIAHAPRQAAIRRRWRDVNELRKPDRPPVWCRPVAAWQELLPDGSLVCRDPGLRSLERQLREILIKDEIGDDSPVSGFLDVGARWTIDPPTVWGMDIGKHRPAEKGGAWLYDPPLKEAADLSKLAFPRFVFDRDATDRALAAAQAAAGDLLPPRLRMNPPLGATLCTTAAELRGLTPLLMDMLDDPPLVHRLMEHLQKATLAAMDAAEATGLLTTNHDEPMTCSDPFGPARAGGGAGLANLWCMANSQELDPVSPAMWEEFLLDYQKPLFARFGRVAYGCCENLTHKIDGVLSIPNLRIFVCSAWTDLSKVVERVGDKHVIMWRQKATDVVHAPDAAALRKALRDGLGQLKGCHVQIVLRELQTLNGRLDRLHEWARIAIEEAARIQ